MVRYLAPLFVLAVVGCSLIVDTSDRAQCSISADCAANPALAGRVCRGGFCELDPQPVSNEAGSGCTTSAACTAQNSGKKSVCRQAGGACVALEIDGCIERTEGWDDPNVIIVGSLLPLTLIQPTGKAPDNPYAKRVLRAIELGANELRDAQPGGYSIGAKQRPVAVIHCDSRGDPAVAKKMFTHLTDVAGAQAVIVGWDEDLYAVAADAQQKQTTLVCSDCLIPAPSNTVTWRILPNITGDAALARWRIGELEAKKSGAIKVAILGESLRVQDAFVAELASTLVFNGQSAASQLGGAFRIEKAPDPRAKFPDYEGIAKSIADFTPDIIVAAVASDFPNKYLPAIEMKWPAGKDRPFYVLTQISYDATSFDGALPPTSAGDELRARISGTHPFTTPELAQNIATFELAYAVEYQEPASGNYSGYEAFYATALAIAGAASSGKPTLDTQLVSSGFAKLVSGSAFDIGKNGFANILGTLAQGTSWNIRGLYTDLDWSTAREVPADMGMFCFDRKPGASLTIHNVDSVRWSAATGQVTSSGTFTCP